MANFKEAQKSSILEKAILLGGKNDSKTRQQIDEMMDFESKLPQVII